MSQTELTFTIDIHLKKNIKTLIALVLHVSTSNNLCHSK